MVSENEIDFKTIVSRFKEKGFLGFTCLEYVHVDWEGCNKTDNVSETIQLQKLLRKLSV